LTFADIGTPHEVVPLADKCCTLNIITRVVDYLKKHAEFEASSADDEVRKLFTSHTPKRSLAHHAMQSLRVCPFLLIV
jgi:hypothetical protein